VTTNSSPSFTLGKRNFRGRLSTPTKTGVMPLNLLMLAGFFASSTRRTLAEVRLDRSGGARAGVVGGVKAGTSVCCMEVVPLDTVSALSFDSDDLAFETRLYGERADMLLALLEGVIFLLSGLEDVGSEGGDAFSG